MCGNFLAFCLVLCGLFPGNSIVWCYVAFFLVIRLFGVMWPFPGNSIVWCYVAFFLVIRLFGVMWPFSWLLDCLVLCGLFPGNSIIGVRKRLSVQDYKTVCHRL